MNQCQLFNLISGFFFGGPAAETRDGQADRNVGILSHRRGKAGAGAFQLTKHDQNLKEMF